MGKNTFNPEFAVEGEGCANCPVPLKSSKVISSFHCGYAGNKTKAEQNAAALSMAAEVVKENDLSGLVDDVKAAAGPWAKGADFAGLMQAASRPDAATSPAAQATVKAMIDEIFSIAFSAPERTLPGPDKELRDEVIGLLSSPDPEDFMRVRVVDSLEKIKLHLKGAYKVAKTFGWEHLEIELINTIDFLSRAIDTAKKTVTKIAKAKEEHTE
jgi:hypothetical protein